MKALYKSWAYFCVQTIEIVIFVCAAEPWVKVTDEGNQGNIRHFEVADTEEKKIMVSVWIFLSFTPYSFILFSFLPKPCSLSKLLTFFNLRSS